MFINASFVLNLITFLIFAKSKFGAEHSVPSTHHLVYGLFILTCSFLPFCLPEVQPEREQKSATDSKFDALQYSLHSDHHHLSPRGPFLY
jgi:hypothetical protein